MIDVLENLIANAWAELSTAVRERNPDEFAEVKTEYAQKIDALYAAKLSEANARIESLEEEIDNLQEDMSEGK